MWLIPTVSNMSSAEIFVCNMKKNHGGDSEGNATRKILAKAIRRLYDPIINEPIPQRLLSTVRRKIENGRPAISMQDARTHAKKISD
jgi:hypothetical protein